MRYGFVIPGGDVVELLELGEAIERAGWDGVFLAEYVYGVDPWVVLGAIAVRTERVLLGTLLTPPSRRRPWKLASELATLDRLSNGRAVVTVGLGALDTGFAAVGEETDRKLRAELMDECLDVMAALWSGSPFTYTGKHYQVKWDATWSFQPVQSPGVPVWAVALWPRSVSMERARRLDGVVPAKQSPSGEWIGIAPDDVRAIRAQADEKSTSDRPFEIVIEGVTPIGDEAGGVEIVRPFAEAGGTWWIESMWDAPGGLDAVRARIAHGPPRVE